MLSKARFIQNTTKLKENSKTKKSAINKKQETANLSSATVTKRKPTKTTKRISKTTSTPAYTTITTATAINRVRTAAPVSATTATNGHVINYKSCCWHFLLCCYCCLFICIVQQHGIQAEISSMADTSGVMAIGIGSSRNSANAGNGVSAGGGGGGSGGVTDGFSSLLNNFDGAHCSSHKFNNMAKTIDDVEDLELDVPVNIAFDNRQRKR